MGKRHGNRRGKGPRVAGLLAGLLAGLITAQGLAAQQPSATSGERTDPTAAGESIGIEAGTRVRITTSSSPEPVVGTVGSLEPGSIQLLRETDESIVTISREEIQRIERSRVRRTADQRAAPGMVAGGLLGLVVGVATTENAEETDCDPRNPFCINLDLPSNKAMAGMGGFLIGMIGGGLISLAIVPGESWEDASLPTLTAGTDADGAFLAFRIPSP